MMKGVRIVTISNLYLKRNFSQRVMKAIVCDGFGEPEVMKIDDKVPIPADCGGPDHVLLRVEATGVNRADTMQVRNERVFISLYLEKR
jgi:NADPH:quinone reductase-like Zn-dependent oxidoreductase